MTSQNNQTQPFWSGFVVGSLVGTGIMYLLATKNGREQVEKLLENTENFEGSVQGILKFLQETDIFNKVSASTTDKKEDMSSVMDKMSSMLYNKNDVKK